ncbi:LysR family transcriptional regulator [Vibrio sp. CAIM 722]|uniref:LysR family transcriptional regulator n=1 Tax=Vibrio eleionomae TaxID=2653505 RepID=A0A7X4LPT8_9VIBR|nr:LysR family transcriptional regulator [Vibrio eleionomae]MZI95970.1 LysR family transcriptional regulator [Vibrio eleionomae]
MINRIDINLLVVLNKLLEEKHVSNTAFSLNMSQPKVSRSLQKLRELFGDELLVRTSNGYELTPKAVNIQSNVSHVLHNLNSLFQTDTFIPAESDDKIRLYALPSTSNLVIPDVVAKANQLAPNMVLDINSTAKDHFAALLSGDIHFAISTTTPKSGEQDLYRIPLFDWDHCLLMREDHPLAQQELTVNNLLDYQYGHISVNNTCKYSFENQFSELGLLTGQRQFKTVIQLTDFVSAAGIAEKTDILFYVPHRLAEQACIGRKLITRNVPETLNYPSESVYLYWHKRYHSDPMCIWFRSLFKKPTESEPLTVEPQWNDIKADHHFIYSRKMANA